MDFAKQFRRISTVCNKKPKKNPPCTCCIYSGDNITHSTDREQVVGSIFRVFFQLI